MERTVSKGLPPSASEVAVRRRKQRALGDNIRNGRSAKGWNQSALAREVWGETTNKRTGRVSAKNRDRISVYEKGKSWPLPHNLKKIANALGVSPEELQREAVAQIVERDNTSFSMVTEGDKVRVRLNRLLTMSIATQILVLLNGSGT
jgi:transcriptional regulator with XRE-family HTH domain